MLKIRVILGLIILSGLFVTQASAATPSDLAATSKTKDLLKYLSNLSSRTDKKILSGQFCLDDSTSCLVTTHTNTGEWVGILGMWFRQQKWGQQIYPALINYANNGGIVHITFIPDNPDSNPKDKGYPYAKDIYLNPRAAVDFNQLLTSGNPINDWFIATLNLEAANLKRLSDQNIPVIWRPYPEMNAPAGGGWNWWGGVDPTDYKRLWIYTYNYLTQTKGLHNLLFAWTPVVWSPNNTGSGLQPLYPGDQYVDIVGFDAYDQGADMSGLTKTFYTTIQGFTIKPIAMAEYGYCPGGTTCSSQDLSPLIKSIKNNIPNTVFWMNWEHPFGLCDNTGVSALLQDSWVINRDDITTTPSTLVGDLNGDKIVNSIDSSIMNSKWFTSDSAADLNHDGIVNAIDFSILDQNWLKTIP
jgi:mannan endo-1,4-beta-mannosidase